MLTYFARISPIPERIILFGAWIKISGSAITASGHLEFKEIFSPLLSIEEDAEAKPSIEGAVATMISGTFFAAATILQVSLRTPPPTAITESQATSQYINASPTVFSSGAGFSLDIT